MIDIIELIIIIRMEVTMLRGLVVVVVTKVSAVDEIYIIIIIISMLVLTHVIKK